MVKTNSIGATITANGIIAGNTAGTEFSSIASGNNSVLITSGAGVPSISATLPAAVQGNITALSQSVLTSTANTGATSQWALTNTATANGSSARIALTTSTNSVTQSYVYYWAVNNFGGYSFGCNSTQNNYWLWRGSPLAGNPVAFWDVNNLFNNAGAISCGTGGVVGGTIQMNGSTSQSVTLTPAANAGDWSFNFPTTAGTAGQALLSDGGAGGMTWGSTPVTFNADAGTPFSSASPTFTSLYTVSNPAGASVYFQTTGTSVVLRTGDINGSTFIGQGCGVVAAGINGTGNTAIGRSCLATLNNGNYNFAGGYQALLNLDGSYNIGLGNICGLNCVGTESSNILFNSQGVLSESNALRIGDATGTGNQQLNKAYICGIRGATLSAGSPTPYLMLMDTSDDQAICPTPVAANTASSAFGSLAVGTALQNTSNYPILVNVSMAVTAATTAVILVGVGSTNTPTAQAVTASFSAAQTYSFSFVVPAKFYGKVTTTGTITVGSITTFVSQIG